MCIVQQVSRNTYYYHLRKKEDHEKQAAKADFEERIFNIYSAEPQQLWHEKNQKRTDETSHDCIEKTYWPRHENIGVFNQLHSRLL